MPGSPISSPATNRPHWRHYLEKQALESPGAGRSRPRRRPALPPSAAAAPGGKILEYGIDILIQGNCLDQAAKVLAAGASADPVFARLKKAHLAMRRKDYRELGATAGRDAAGRRQGIPRRMAVPEFHLPGKDRQGKKADEYAKKIKSPYYRNLSLIQWSDRSIYNRGLRQSPGPAGRRPGIFSAPAPRREEIETQSQMAKLLREIGRFPGGRVPVQDHLYPGRSRGPGLELGLRRRGPGQPLPRERRRFPGRMLVSESSATVSPGKRTRRHHAGEFQPGQYSLRQGQLAGSRQAACATILAWDEEKRLLNSCAIDLLNWADLETLRLHDDKALKLIDHADEIFQDSANSKGLTECAFLRGRISGFAEKCRRPRPTAMPLVQRRPEDRLRAVPPVRRAAGDTPGSGRALFKMLARPSAPKRSDSRPCGCC